MEVCGWIDPRAGLGIFEKKDLSLAHPRTSPLPRESNHDSSVVQAVTQLLCRLSHPGLQFFMMSAFFVLIHIILNNSILIYGKIKVLRKKYISGV